MMLSPPSPTLRMEIDTGAIAENIARLRGMLQSPARMTGVVKADAYGLGLDVIAPVMLDNGIDLFFVANLGEALKLRRIIGMGPRIALMGGYYEASPLWTDLRLIPVLNSLDELTKWQSATNGLPSFLHIDTGMNRLGVRYDEVQAIPASYKPDLVISHFASADEPGHPQTEQQFLRFMEATNARFPGVPRSLANSAGVMGDKRYHLDYVRTGKAVYGQPILDDRPNPMQRAVRLLTKVLTINHVKAGDTLGYSATYTCPKDATLATVGVGYADGLCRTLSNNGNLYFKDAPCPIRGRVSMDLTIIEITDHPTPPQAGDWVEIIGPHQSELDLARKMDTITYEVMTNFGNGGRCERIVTSQAQSRSTAAA